MTATTTTTKTIPSSGWHDCAVCGERLVPGSRGLRSGSRWTHRAACSAPVAVLAPVTALAPIYTPEETAATLRAVAPHVAAGRLPTYGGPERHGRSCPCSMCAADREEM